MSKTRLVRCKEWAGSEELTLREDVEKLEPSLNTHGDRPSTVSRPWYTL